MEIFKLTKKNFGKITKIAGKSIKEGKILICPTDTVYGLIADATNKKAVKKIFQIKKRSFKKPIPIFVKDIKMAKRIAKINQNQEKFLRKVWPGKVTIRLRRKGNKKLYGVDKKTIALRIPKYKFLKILLEKLDFPLVQTSANISREPPVINIKEALEMFDKKKNKPTLIIDGGVLENKQSKLIDLTTNPPKVLRP